MNDNGFRVQADFELMCALLSQSLRAALSANEITSAMWSSFTDEQREHFLAEWGDNEIGGVPSRALLVNALTAIEKDFA